MSREFKKGDKVRIKHRCDIESTADTSFVREMDIYCGKDTYISKVNPSYSGDAYYSLNIDGGIWCWEGEWLELVED